MKISVELLTKYIKKASLNGSIPAINMNFTKDSIKSGIRDPAQIAMTLTSMPSSLVEDYEALGELFITNTSAFLTYLKSFEDKVELTKEDEYTLKLVEGNREAHIILGSEIVCQDSLVRTGMPKLDLPVSINLTKKNISKSVTDMGNLKINQITFTNSKSKFVIEVGHKGESDYFKATLPSTFDAAAKTRVGTHFVNYFNIAEDNFTLNIGTDIPILITENSDITLVVIIAPQVENND